MKLILVTFFVSILLTFVCAEQRIPKIGVGADDTLDIHPPFEEPPKIWHQKDELPIEQQVIQITGELYDEIITMRILGVARNEVPWVLVFVKKESIDSKRAMAQYSELAKHLNGTVRFGWVDGRKEELLSESFGSRELPSTFFIKDGVVYHYRDFTYAGKLLKYITEGSYINSTTSFYQPARFVQP